MTFQGMVGFSLLKIKMTSLMSLLYGINKSWNIFNKNIKYVKTDNDKEFINSNFINFFQEHSIIFQNTVAYNPQQNGRNERLNGTLIK